MRWISNLRDASSRGTAALALAAGLFTDSVPAETFDVDRFDDPDPETVGQCDAAVPLDCSLRRAVFLAVATPNPPHTVKLQAGLHILTRSGVDDIGLVGDLDLLVPMLIQGAGEAETVVNGDSIDPDHVLGIGPSVSDVVLEDLTIVGGRHAVRSDGSVTLNRVSVSNGRPCLVNTGGAMVLNDVTIEDCRSSIGGGIFNMGSLSVAHSVFSHNSAPAGVPGDGGAGLHSLGGTVLIQDSHFRFNRSDRGGGILLSDADATIERTLFSFNGGDLGVAVLVDLFGTAVIRNSTFSGNDSDGSVLAVMEGTLRLDSITVANNSGGGAPNAIAGSDLGQVSLTNSAFDAPCDDAPVYTSLGGNVTTVVNSCGLGFSDRLVSDLRLLPLGDYGGPTETMPPGPDSILIDLLPGSGGCPPPTQDQRGFGRPAGQRCDAGAVEYQGMSDPANNIFSDGYEAVAAE